MFNISQIEKLLYDKYEITDPTCSELNTAANYAIEVRSASGHYALKIYNPASRTPEEVQWEIDLTLHLIQNHAPVVKPVPGLDNNYLQSINLDDTEYTTVLFEWAPGEKPKPELSTYVLLGEAAARIHTAADTFTSNLPREKYDVHELIDDQIERMRLPLEQSGQLQRVADLAERMREIITNPKLDWGVCHMDLTLDNIHRNGNTLMVFDFDSSGESWRAVEPWGVLRAAEERFKAWLQGYRSVREFSDEDEDAVAAFGIVEDIRNVVWKLGYAKSSRGEPLLLTRDLEAVVDEWLEWEKLHIQ